METPKEFQEWWKLLCKALYWIGSHNRLHFKGEREKEEHQDVSSTFVYITHPILVAAGDPGMALVQNGDGFCLAGSDGDWNLSEPITAVIFLAFPVSTA